MVCCSDSHYHGKKWTLDPCFSMNTSCIEHQLFWFLRPASIIWKACLSWEWKRGQGGAFIIDLSRHDNGQLNHYLGLRDWCVDKRKKSNNEGDSGISILEWKAPPQPQIQPERDTLGIASIVAALVWGSIDDTRGPRTTCLVYGRYILLIGICPLDGCYSVYIS